LSFLKAFILRQALFETVFFYTRPPPQKDFVPDLHNRFAQCRTGTIIKRKIIPLPVKTKISGDNGKAAHFFRLTKLTNYLLIHLSKNSLLYFFSNQPL